MSNQPKVDRDLLLLQFWLTEGDSFSKAARRAGFAKGLSKAHKLASKSFQAKLRSFAPDYHEASMQAIALKAIPAIDRAVELYCDKPQLVIDKPALLDRVQRAAGLQSETTESKTQVINIKAIQNIIGKAINYEVK